MQGKQRSGKLLLYARLYDVLQNPEHRMTRTEKVNRLKAQLIQLYRERAAAGMIEMQSLDSFQEERISLFHIIKRRTWREKRTISQVTDPNGRKHTSTAIIETFVAHFGQKFQLIQVDEACVKSMLDAGHRRLPEDLKEILDGPLTTEELRLAVEKGGKKRQAGMG